MGYLVVSFGVDVLGFSLVAWFCCVVCCVCLTLWLVIAGDSGCARCFGLVWGYVNSVVILASCH